MDLIHDIDTKILVKKSTSAPNNSTISIEKYDIFVKFYTLIKNTWNNLEKAQSNRQKNTCRTAA